MAAPVDADALGDALASAEAELAALLASDEQGEIETAKARARATAKYWGLQALVLAKRGEHQDSTRAASQAAAAQELLIKAAKADLVTRVEELEQLVTAARDRGVQVRELAAKRKRKRPPGADPRP